MEKPSSSASYVSLKSCVFTKTHLNLLLVPITAFACETAAAFKLIVNVSPSPPPSDKVSALSMNLVASLVKG